MATQQPDQGRPGADWREAPAPAPLSLRVEDGPGEWVVMTLAGEIDLSTAPTLKTELLTTITRRSPHLIIDLSGVDFMDSSGLAALTAALRRTQLEGGRLRLVGPSSMIRKELAITGLDRVIAIDDTVDDVIRDPDRSPQANAEYAQPGWPRPRER